MYRSRMPPRYIAKRRRERAAYVVGQSWRGMGDGGRLGVGIGRMLAIVLCTFDHPNYRHTDLSDQKGFWTRFKSL